MKWESPYQSGPLNAALIAAGLDSKRVGRGDDRAYANRLQDGWRVHELAAVSKTPLEVPSTVFSGVSSYETTYWSEGDYFTPIVLSGTRPEAGYSASTRRNIRRARDRGCVVVREAPADEEWPQLEADMARLFAPHAAHLPVGLARLCALVRAGQGLGSVTLFRAYVPTEQLVAVAVALHSARIANVRFTAFDMGHSRERPMNLIVHEMLCHFLQGGVDVVDLSGIAGPLGDRSLRGIDRFKLGFTRTIAGFHLVRGM